MTTVHPLAARPRRIVSARRSLAQLAILTLALLWSAVASAQVGPLQTRVVVDRTYEAVVQIRVPIGVDDDGRRSVGFGSGTIVSPAGYVLTNHHVVADGSQVAAHIEIWRQEGPHEPLRHAFDATFVAGDPQLDLAVVRIVSDANGRPVGGGFTFFPIGDFRALGVKITDPIDAIGYPTAGGQSITHYPGTVSGFAGEFDFRELFRLSQARDSAAVDRMVAAIPAGDTWIKTTAPFTGGISGGALLDGDGNLIGVPTVSLTALRLARPAILARPLLRDVPGVVFVERAEHGAVAPDPTDVLHPGQEANGQTALEPSPPTGRTPQVDLRGAAITLDAEAVEEALAAGAMVDEVDAEGRTALMLAAQFMRFADDVDGTTAVFTALLAAGADANVQDSDGLTPIMRVVGLRDFGSVVQALLAAGADANARDRNDWTPIMHAAHYSGDVASLRALLDAGANVNAQDAHGLTPLTLAARTQGVEAVQTLIAGGAEVNHRDGAGWTALMNAARFNHSAVVAALLAAGASVNVQDGEGWTALLAALDAPFFDARLMENRSAKVLALVDAGAAVDVRLRNGRTALMLAVRNLTAEAVQAMLAAGADVNAQDENGWTVLMHAAHYSLDPAVVPLLVGAGGGPLPPSVFVTSDSAGATIVVNGVERGSTPSAIHLVPGEHTVSVSLGSRCAENTISVQPGERISMELVLEDCVRGDHPFLPTPPGWR